MKQQILGAVLACLPALAMAAPAIEVVDGWARAMPPVAKNSAGYVVIRNTGDADDALLGAVVEGARVTELHEMVHADGAMAMRRRAEIAVPAGGEVRLKPGGLHLMLIDLQQPLKPGGQRRATLRFREAGEVEVTLEVRGQ